MEHIILIKVIAIIIVGLVIWWFLIKGIIQDGRGARKAYMDAIYRFDLKQNAEWIKETCRDDSFFEMTNNGDDPCDLKEEIEYVDYIGKNKSYMEISVND